MRKLAVLTFMTLDGVMQAPGHPEEDTSGDFKHGGWAARYWEEVMEQVNEEAMAQPFDLLFGRKTYEIFAGYWPNVENSAHGDKLNNATKYVVTSTLKELTWKNSTPITGDITTEVSQLKKEDGPLLQIHGSSQLIHTLLANDLIDEFRLWTFPLVVGSGKRLFDQGTVPTNMTLLKTQSTADGVVMGIYRRAGTS